MPQYFLDESQLMVWPGSYHRRDISPMPLRRFFRQWAAKHRRGGPDSPPCAPGSRSRWRSPPARIRPAVLSGSVLRSRNSGWRAALTVFGLPWISPRRSIDRSRPMPKQAPCRADSPGLPPMGCAACAEFAAERAVFATSDPCGAGRRWACARTGAALRSDTRAESWQSPARRAERPGSLSPSLHRRPPPNRCRAPLLLRPG